jgi:hypothetical protein
VVVTGVTVVPTVIDAQLIFPDPVIVATGLTEVLLWRVIPAVTVRVTPELTVNVRAVAAVLEKVIELIVASAVTVMLSPGRMITSSVEAGTIPLGQGAFGVVEFQLPLPDVVIFAA